MVLLRCCACLQSLRGCRQSAAKHVPGLLQLCSSAGHMLLDACALRSLELLSNSEGKVNGHLMGWLPGAAAGHHKAWLSSAHSSALCDVLCSCFKSMAGIQMPPSRWRAPCCTSLTGPPRRRGAARSASSSQTRCSGAVLYLHLAHAGVRTGALSLQAASWRSCKHTLLHGRRCLLLHDAVPCRVGDIQERLATTELFMAHPQAAHDFQSGLHRAPGGRKRWSFEVHAHAKLRRLR